MNSLIELASESEVSGPVAMTVNPCGNSLSSSSMTVIFSFSCSVFVISPEKASRSTAKAPPAGTLFSSAAFIIKESSCRISSFKSPAPLVNWLARKEFVQTSSAKFPV